MVSCTFYHQITKPQITSGFKFLPAKKSLVFFFTCVLDVAKMFLVKIENHNNDLSRIKLAEEQERTHDQQRLYSGSSLSLKPQLFGTALKIWQIMI